MFSAKSRLFAAAIGAVSMGAAAAWAADNTAQQDAKIRELEAKVAALEARQASSAREIAATIDKVLRDAEKRSQLLAAGGDTAAGYDNGFFIRSGAWELRPGAMFQFRGVADFRSDTFGDKGDETETGFEVRRMKFILEGTALTKDLTYCFTWDTEVEGGSLKLSDAWAKYMFADEFGVRLGQFRDPVVREWLVSDGKQLAVERSLMDAVLGGGFTGYTQGVTLIYGNYNKNNPVNVEFGVTDGANQVNTNFAGRPEPLPDPDPTTGLVTPSGHTLDWGIAGRVEVKAMGNWANYQDFSAMGTKEDLLVFGLGGDWSQGGDGDVWMLTADVQYESAAGLGVYAAAIYRDLDDELSGTTESWRDWGLLVQCGYMLNPSWEIFGRYDVIFADNDIVFDDGNTEDTFHEITVGVNYYMGKNGAAGHRAKVTIDLTYLPNGAPGAAPGLGILDANAGENEWILRGQFQLWL